jgi:hypothetical protein
VEEVQKRLIPFGYPPDALRMPFGAPDCQDAIILLAATKHYATEGLVELGLSG